MKITKQELLLKLSEAIDKLERFEDLELEYLCINFADYNPDNRKYETKYCYRQFSIDLDKAELKISDSSEPFKCTMGYRDCEERGYCKGDC